MDPNSSNLWKKRWEELAQESCSIVAFNIRVPYSTVTHFVCMFNNAEIIDQLCLSSDKKIYQLFNC